MMIYFKLILLCLLSALPFVLAQCFRSATKSSAGRRTVFSFITAQAPRLKAVKDALVNFLLRVYEGMKRSDNFRKFFTLLTLLLMTCILFVDYSASQEIARLSLERQEAIENDMLFAQVYGPLMSRPHATFIATFLGLSFFFYKVADRLLTVLHNEGKIFYFFAVLTLIILFSSPRYIIIVEIMLIILLAAVIYPNKTAPEEPKTRKQIPIRPRRKNLLKTA